MRYNLYRNMVMDAEFKEDEHPRDSDGKFTNKGSSESSGGEENKKLDKNESGVKVYKNTMKKVREFKAKSDGTYDFNTGKPKDYPDGYSVSFHQNEPDENGKWKSDYGRYTEEDYDKNVVDMVEKTGGELNVGYFSGTPEVSVWVKDVFKAVKFAIDNNQQSIWDWEKGDVLENPYYDPKKNPMKE